MNGRHRRNIAFFIGVSVFLPLAALGEFREDVHVLAYHDGTPTSSWTAPTSSYWFHMWCGRDVYFDGVDPPGSSDNPMTIQKLRLYHFGEGDFRVRVAVVDATETDSRIVELIGTYEFSTTCSDCWEDFELNQFIVWNQVGGTFPGHMTAFILDPLSVGGDGLPAPRLGVGGCEDDPDGTPHPHPRSSQIGTSDVGFMWHEDTWSGAPCGDYLIDVYWFMGEQTNAETESFSSVKTKY